MAKCDVCGNDYDKSFQITSAGKTRTFDGFECAIHMLAPTCPHCNCKVIGHGVEAGGPNLLLRPLRRRIRRARAEGSELTRD